MILPTEETQLYYKLSWSLFAYVNRHLGIEPEITAAEDVGRLHPQRVAKVRDAVYENPNWLEQFIAENPEGFLSEELAIISSWRHRFEGDFYIMRFLKRYAVLMDATESGHLYGVLGLYDPLEVVVRGLAPPVLVRTVLLPFKDWIIYDGLVTLYSIHFGSGIRSSLNGTYSRLKEREGIIEKLVGPTGEAQAHTSLDRRSPRKPAPDWRPVVEEIVAQVERMRQADTRLQATAFGLLRAVTKLTQSTLQQPKDGEEHFRHLRSVRAALTKLENLLYEEEYGGE
jgi:hypothetical protein